MKDYDLNCTKHEMEMALNGALSVTLDAEFNENASLSGLVSVIVL